MKNLRLVLILIFALSFYTNHYSQIDLGVIGGLNIASFKADTDISSRWLWGAGAVLDYNLGNNFSLRTEPMYLKKGGIQEQSDENPKLTIDQSFLEIPIFLRYSLGEETKLYFLAGPSIGILLSSDLEAYVNSYAFTADFKDLTENLDMGLCLGTGVSFPLDRYKLFFELKYMYGLTNLAKSGKFKAKSGHLELDGEFDEEESKYNSRGIQLLVGFAFQI